MAVEEFSPEPPPPQPNPGAMWAGFLLVVVAVAGGIGIFWFMTTRQAEGPSPGPNGAPVDLPPPVRSPSVVEVTDEALKASSALGLALAVTDVATSGDATVCRWAGKIALTNGGPNPVEIEAPDAGNTYVEMETGEGVRSQSRQESKALRRRPLAPGASETMEWRDEFRPEVTRIRFVHVETSGDERRVVATPWIELPKGGK